VKDGKPKNARLNKHAAAPVATADLVVSPAGQVVRAVIDGKPVFFTLTNTKDVIQKEHLAGRFYRPKSWRSSAPIARRTRSSWISGPISATMRCLR
jgi:hypothetical protein